MVYFDVEQCLLFYFVAKCQDLRSSARAQILFNRLNSLRLRCVGIDTIVLMSSLFCCVWMGLYRYSSWFLERKGFESAECEQ